MVNKPRKKAKSEYKFTKLTNIFNLLFCDELFSLCYFFVLKLFYYDLIMVEQKNIWANHNSILERKIRAYDFSGFQKPLSPVWVKV